MPDSLRVHGDQHRLACNRGEKAGERKDRRLHCHAEGGAGRYHDRCERGSAAALHRAWALQHPEDWHDRLQPFHPGHRYQYAALCAVRRQVRNRRVRGGCGQGPPYRQGAAGFRLQDLIPGPDGGAHLAFLK